MDIDSELPEEYTYRFSERLLSNDEVNLIENCIAEKEKTHGVRLTLVGYDEHKAYYSQHYSNDAVERMLGDRSSYNESLIVKYVSKHRDIEILPIFHLLYNDLLPKISPFSIMPVHNYYDYKVSIYLEEDVSQIIKNSKLSIIEEIKRLQRERNNLQNYEKRYEIDKEIKFYQRKELFLNELTLLRELLKKKNLYSDCVQMLWDIFAECDGHLGDSIQDAHVSILGEKFFELELMDDSEFVKKIMKFQYEKRWIRKDEIQCPIQILWWVYMYSHSYKKLMNESKITKIWDQVSKEVAIENFERKITGQRRVITPDFSSLTGEQFEKFTKEIFENLGYYVFLTPPTGDQGADLIIEQGTERVVVQTKCYSNQNVGNSAIQEIVAAKRFYKADSGMVVTNSNFSSSALRLAEANEIELWDGEKLRKMIDFINTT